jgi:ankyrin repeat protein
MYYFHRYIEHGNLEQVARHVQRDSDVLDQRYSGRTPLMTAIKYNQLEIVEFLASRARDYKLYLDKPCHYNETHYIFLNSFEYSIKHSNLGCLRILLRNGYDPIIGNFNPVELATHYNANREVVDFLQQMIENLEDDEIFFTPLTPERAIGYNPRLDPNRKNVDYLNVDHFLRIDENCKWIGTPRSAA